MSLLSRVAGRTPEVINEASEGAKELIIAPGPDIIAPATNVAAGLSLSAVLVFAAVTILAGITIWQTIKLYKPTLFSRFLLPQLLSFLENQYFIQVR
jgi:hypothetical protein